MGCTVAPILGVLALELVTEVAFVLGECRAGGCAPTLGWNVLPRFPWLAAATVRLRWRRWD